MPTFAEQLTRSVKRVGVTDAELARKIGVQRQTIFRWKEGTVGQPRVRDDVLRCAECLRLTPEERDQFLVAAGFAPEQSVSVMTTLPAPSTVMPETTTVAAEVIGLEAKTSPPIEAPPAQPTPSQATPDQALPLFKPRVHLPWFSFGGVVITLLLLVMAGILLDRMWLRGAQPVQTPIALATSTPSTAAPGGIVVSQFSTVLEYPRYDVAKRIKEALDTEIGKAKLLTTTVLIWPQDIANRESAEAVLKNSMAALVIWGEYDSGRVVANFTVPDHGSDQREIAIDNPNELNSTINVKIKQEVQVLAMLTLGKLYLSEQAYAKADQAFAQALALKPQEKDTLSTLYFYAGLTAQNKAEQARSIAEYDRAIANYTQMIALQPGLVNGIYNRGLSYSNRSDMVEAGSVEIGQNLDAAIADFTRVLSQYANPADVYINRGVAYYKRKTTSDLQSALQDFSHAIALQPDSYLGYYDRSLARIRAGGSLDWQTDLTTTVKLNATYYPALDLFCLGYALAQAPKTALAYCEQAVQFAQADPADPSMDTRLNRGIVYAELGRYAEALADLQSYLTWLKHVQPPTLYERMNGKKVEAWMAAIRQNKNPFDQATLDALR